MVLLLNAACHRIWDGVYSLYSANKNSRKYNPWLNIVFVRSVTRRVPPVEQKLLTILEHLSTLPVFSGVHVAQSLLLCVVLCRPLVVILWGGVLPLHCLPFDLRLLLVTMEPSWPWSYNCWIYNYAISAYHHWCEFESRPGRGAQHYLIKFVSDLWQVSGFLLVFWFLPAIKLTAMI